MGLLAPDWAPVQSKIAQLEPKLGFFGGQPRPKVGANCADSATQRYSFLAWMGARDQAMLPTLGRSWAQLLRQDQVAHVKPNLRLNVPALRHVGPWLG